jgi:hypothetical protein
MSTDRHRNRTHTLLVEVQRRLPAGQRFAQEAFTSEHRRPVMVKIGDLRTETFYLFDETATRAFSDSVIELAGREPGGDLMVSYPFFGEFQSQQHRLQHLAKNLESVSVMSVGELRNRSVLPSRVEYHNVAGTPLARYRIALARGATPALFIARDMARPRPTGDGRVLGFFTFDADVVEQFGVEAEMLLSGLVTRLATFERLEQLHQTTQRVARELQSYSERMENAIRRAQRRPDLLTPARFQRIVGQAIAKMEQLKEIPRRALRSIERHRR